MTKAVWMCYAVPGRVTSIVGNSVTVDYFAEEKKAFNDLTVFSFGDLICAQGGYIIEKGFSEYFQDSRIARLKRAYELGYIVMTSALIGTPGQTPDDIINDKASRGVQPCY